MSGGTFFECLFRERSCTPRIAEQLFRRPSLGNTRHARLSSWTYGSRIRSISRASEDGLQGLKRRRDSGGRTRWFICVPIQLYLSPARTQRLRAAPVRQQPIHKGYAKVCLSYRPNYEAIGNSSTPFRCNFGALQGGDCTVPFRVSDISNNADRVKSFFQLF
jgi:hypothetical protein